MLWARPVAYFSAEFGLHESLPIYSGGLGVLAGDHIKSASDLGIPLVGVGLYYDQGYFRQRLDHDGWQHEEYIDVDSRLLPMQPAQPPDGEPVIVRDRDAHRHHLRARLALEVGRNTLLLLDSDVEGNSPEDRELTARLYGGDERIAHPPGAAARRRRRAGAWPRWASRRASLHLNEGHSAFAALELVRQRMETEGIDADEALRRVCGADRVHDAHAGACRPRSLLADLVEEHLGPLREALGCRYDQLMALGRVNPRDDGEQFCMTVLALKASRRANAVSSLHGHVSRAMWTSLYPGVAEERVPIGHITNGVHVPTWLAPQMHQVYDRHFGAGLAAALRRSRLSGKRSTAWTMASCGRRIRRSRRSSSSSRGAGRGAARERRGEAGGVSRAAAARAQSRRADDRLRPALRDLQARQPRAAGHRGARRRSSTIRRCRCSSSSRARRIRTTAPARTCCSRSRS